MSEQKNITYVTCIQMKKRAGSFADINHGGQKNFYKISSKLSDVSSRRHAAVRLLNRDGISILRTSRRLDTPRARAAPLIVLRRPVACSNQIVLAHTVTISPISSFDKLYFCQMRELSFSVKNGGPRSRQVITGLPVTLRKKYNISNGG